MRRDSRAQRQAERLTNMWGAAPRVLIDGDAELVVAALRKAASEAKIPLLDPHALGLEDAGATASVAVIAVRSTDRSSLRAGMVGLEAVQHLVSDDAIRIVVTVSDRVDMAPKTLSQLLGPEILHQVAAASSFDSERSTWRSLKLRIGASMLLASGLHVFQVGRMRPAAR